MTGSEGEVAVLASADVVVVGGGPAGCALAGTLAERSSAEVLLVEAGPDYGPHDSGRWPSDLLEAFDLAESHGWNYHSEDLIPGRMVAFSRARVIGGCSAHNGCAAIWGHRADYDAWAAAGNEGWSTDDLLPIFHHVSERMRVRIPGAEEITPFHGLMLGAAEAIGIPLVDDLNDLDEPVGMAASPANVSNGIRWNAAFAFIDPNRGRPNLRVLGDTLVDRIRIEGDRATGVHVHGPGGAGEIAAGTVVLCGGAYNSPTVLLRSGIGDEVDLQELSIPVVHHLPGVGRNLHDHPAVAFRMAGSDELKTLMREWGKEHWLPEEQTIAKLRSSRCEEAFDLHIYPEGGPYHLGRTEWIFAIPVACMTPRARGAVRLRSADPTVPPSIDHNYLGDPEGHDLAVLADGVEIALDLAAAGNRHGLLGPIIEPPELLNSRFELEAWVTSTVAHYYHAAGSCKMGPASNPEAVVSAQGQLHGLRGLYVADCSIMPQVPRANTNVPAAVVGARVGGWLAEGRN
jgi:choline dehydrogenase